MTVQIDAGKEFLSKKLQHVLQKKGITFKPMRNPDVKHRSPKYSVGDLCCISREKNIFEKRYESGYTLELFKIDHISETLQPVV